MINVELLIQAVKDRPALYRPNHDCFNRKETRMRLWDEIGAIMYPEWPTLEESNRRSKALQMQKKWKSLKDCFNREVRLRKVRQPHKLRKQYEFYDSLSFLLHKGPEFDESTGPPFEVQIKTESLEEAELDLGSHEQQSLHLQEFFPDNPRKSKVPEEEVLRQVRARQERRFDGTEDSERLFLMSFVNDMKKLPLSTKYWVKMKFSEVMHQATMSMVGYQEDENTEYLS